MKRFCLFLLVLLCLTATLSACGSDEPTTTTAEASLTTPTTSDTTAAPADSTSAKPDVTTPWIDPNVEPIVTDDYTAIPNEFEWTSSSATDLSKFDFSGSGAGVVSKLDATYGGYKKTYYLIDADGNKSEIAKLDARKMKTVGVTVTENKAAKTAEFEFVEVISVVEPAWKSVTARAGSYLMFEFTSNLSGNYFITVTAKEGGTKASAAYTQGNVTVTGANGKYTGIAKCTVPYQPGKTFYINICIDDNSSYPIAATVPVTITTAKYDSEYRLQFIGEWEQVKDPEYLPNLVDLFYNVYPRLYARFAFGNEPKEITFEADKQYDGVAYCQGTRVCVSVDYANSNPRDLGFFSHEITHSVQQYSKLSSYGGETSYTDKATNTTYTAKAWWTENMANFGGFRYFHWGYSTKFVQIYNVQTQSSLWNWGWEPYGDGSKLFLSYLDWKFPSVDANNDKKLDVEEYGVIDLINYTIKTATNEFSDNPYDPNSPFNQAVKTATKGVCNTMEEARQLYESDCKNSVFVFTGFRDYVDNWRTEDLNGIPNPTYPTLEQVAKGSITNPILSTALLEGDNLAKGATVSDFSAEASRNPIANLLDGDLDSFWHGAESSIGDYKYELMGISHSVTIDLGEVKTFNTYTLVNRGYKSSNKLFNTAEWEILISTDGKTWTSVDYQTDNTSDLVSVNIGTQSARYIELRIHTADKSNTGNVRIQEFMLFNQ